MIALDIRLIDRQMDAHSILEVYAGPDTRRVRFQANRITLTAFSEVWTPTGWTEVHHLKLPVPCPAPEEAIRRLFSPTEDILGWSKSHG